MGMGGGLVGMSGGDERRNGGIVYKNTGDIPPHVVHLKHSPQVVHCVVGRGGAFPQVVPIEYQVLK